MTEIFDFFAKHYLSITPMLAGAFVSFFIVWFYLKISHQMTGLGKEMVSLGKEIVSLDEEMDDRFAKVYEQFLEFRKEMNEQFLELRKEMNERSAKSDERFVKSDDRFLEFSKEMNDRFMYLIEKIHPMPLRP